MSTTTEYMYEEAELEYSHTEGGESIEDMQIDKYSLMDLTQQSDVGEIVAEREVEKEELLDYDEDPTLLRGSTNFTFREESWREGKKINWVPSYRKSQLPKRVK